MEYKLFEEFITLQALLKELGIIQSGGAIKSFLMEHQVSFNGELETRRGACLVLGDKAVFCFLFFNYGHSLNKLVLHCVLDLHFRYH